MEFIWRPFWDELGERAQIFTHALYNHYYPPQGFIVDETAGDDPIIDDPNLENYNVDEKIELFHNFILKEAEHYKINHLVVTMGGDFFYGNAHMTF